MDLLKTFGTDDVAEILEDGQHLYAAFVREQRSVIEWFLEKFSHSDSPDHTIEMVCHVALHACIYFEKIEMLRWFVEERERSVDVRGFTDEYMKVDLAHAVGEPCWRYVEAVEAEQNIVGPEVWHEAIQKRKSKLIVAKRI